MDYFISKGEKLLTVVVLLELPIGNQYVPFMTCHLCLADQFHTLQPHSGYRFPVISVTDEEGSELFPIFLPASWRTLQPNSTLS